MQFTCVGGGKGFAFICFRDGYAFAFYLFCGGQWRLRIYFLLFFRDGYRCPSHRQALGVHSPHRSPRLHSLHSLHCLRCIFAAPFFRRPRHLVSLHRLHRRRGLRIEVASVRDFRCLSPQRPQMVHVTYVNGFPLLIRQWYLHQRHTRHRFHWT